MFDVLRETLVLDFGKFVAAPSATWLLSNMGAKVVQIEPVGGSPDREPFRISDELDGAGFRAASQQQAQRLPQPRDSPGRAVLERSCVPTMWSSAEHRPRRFSDRGIDYEALSKINSKLIYLNVSAFTRQGSEGQRHVGFDGIGQVMGGRPTCRASAIRPRGRSAPGSTSPRASTPPLRSPAPARPRTERQGALSRDRAHAERLCGDELAAGRAGRHQAQSDAHREPGAILGTERHLSHA